MTNNQDAEQGTYFEVDIEYKTQAKLVLLCDDEEHVRTVIGSDLEIPDVVILSIIPADAELVADAKARRAFEDAVADANKNKVN